MGEWHTTQASRRRRELSSLISAEAPPQHPRVRPHPRSCGAVHLERKAAVSPERCPSRSSQEVKCFVKSSAGVP